MSGGIDSSMAIKLLQDNGYKVVGATLQLYGNQDTAEIKRIVAHFGIQHFFVDARQAFAESVVSYFVDEYFDGRTPSPCVFCNQHIKFPTLIKIADQHKIDFVATGHYVSKDILQSRYYICKGIDKKKDQSYYLWRLKQDILQRVIFPLGIYKKDTIKRMAEKENLMFLLTKKESMGVCFLKKENYRKLIMEHCKKKFLKIVSGKVINQDGIEIGHHEGYPFYTIGQKNGLNLNIQGEFYVSRINAEQNIIEVNKKESLHVKEFDITEYYFHEMNDINSSGIEIKVRGLGLNPDGFVKIHIIDEKYARVSLENEAWAMAPGQPVVFYDNNRVIGGGYVK